MKKIFLLFAFCSLLFAGAAMADRGSFDLNRWYKILTDIQTRAVADGVNAKTIDSVIQNAVFFPDALYRDQNQAEFKLVMNDYLKKSVNKTRIAAGVRAKKSYKTALRKTNETYGVPPNVILAFWGMESNYGKFKATHKLSDAFLTLIYDGRRETFFGNQLIALMKIADKGNISVADLKGSWAGAMGHFQFIPTTLTDYATDGNGDGKIDIINNVSDAMFSAANYLNKLGWEADEKIAREITFPSDFDVSACDAKTKKSLNDWAALGALNTDGTAIPESATVKAGVVCDSAAEPSTATDANPTPTIRAFLTYDNFYRIKKWNNSNYYAIAIFLLSEELK